MSTVPPPGDQILQEYLAWEAKITETATLPAAEWNADRPLSRTSTSFTYLNHASFGDPHQSTLDIKHHLTTLCYEQPMLYHRSLVPILVARAKDTVCDYLKIPTPARNGFSFCSVTGALFAVLQSIRWEPGDVVITSDMLYHSLTDTLSYLSEQNDIRWVTVDTPDQAQLDDIYHAFQGVLEANSHNKIKLVVIDYISSKPSVLFPVKRICTLCRNLGIPTLVDGAHVPGVIPTKHLDIPSTNATMIAMTLNKWCHAPRGGASGGLWVNLNDVTGQSRRYDWIDTSRLVVHGDDKTSISRGRLYLDHTTKPGFLIDGITQGIYDESTREYENVIVLPHCLALVQRFEADFWGHVQKLRNASRQLLRDAWKLTEQESCMWYGQENVGVVLVPMLCIPLPDHSKGWQSSRLLSGEEGEKWGLDKKLRLLKKKIVLQLWQKFGIEVPIFIWKQRRLGVRITFGRDVTLEDVGKLATAMVTLCEL